MSTPTNDRPRTPVLHERGVQAEDLCESARHGLSSTPKTLPAKFLYDEEGARLFDRICELEAYYPTRTEHAILRRHISEIAELAGPDCLVLEYGSGSGSKTRILLDHLHSPAAFVPVDISREQLIEVSQALAHDYPELELAPVHADYTKDFELPPLRRDARRTLAFFPGSTLGNFEPAEAERFLCRIALQCGTGGALLLGLDLQKDPAVLERAYNDPEGVTAAFNLNVLKRLNRECGADFDLEQFRHRAVYDREHGRIEMHLVSLTDQTVHLDGVEGKPIHFAAGEHITTEHSYKYTLERFREMAARAGFRVEHVWTDARDWFSVQYLEVDEMCS